MSIRAVIKGAVGASDEFLGSASPALQTGTGLAMVVLGQFLWGMIPASYVQGGTIWLYPGAILVVVGVGNFGAGLSRGLLHLAGTDWESAGGVVQTGVLFVVSVFIFALMLSPVILAVLT